MEAVLGMKLGKNPKESIVSVWRGGATDEWIGTAFFVSPSIVLTARHVVEDSKSGEIHNHLFLRLVRGIDKVPIKSEVIYRHDTVDIALIRLTLPYCDQPSLSPSFDNDGHEGCTVKCCGINPATRNQCEFGDYKVGDFLPEEGYLFSYQVAPGTSGGAVIDAASSRVVGVITRRDKYAEQSLYVSLRQIKFWLENLNQDLKDSEIVLLF